jgi:uncharacterized protein (TIGR03083 family)
MEYSAFVDAIRREGAAFVDAARSAGVEQSVPSCPDWTIADLCSHVGRLHRWAAEIVAARPADPTRRWAAFDTPEGPALVDYVEQGYGPLADALGRADGDERCWTWIDDQTVHFWARRQANELAVHRWDAQSATGATEPIERDLAVDSIQELFDILPFRPGGPPTGNGESIHLHCTDGDGDGEWLIRLASDGPVVVNEHAKADVAARGNASDLLLMMWGRIPVDQVEVFGDAALLARWSDGKL